jgi:hypothetical protein
LVATGFLLAAGLDALVEDWADIVATELGFATLGVCGFFGFLNFKPSSPPHYLLPPKEVSSFVKSEFTSPYLSRERLDEVEVEVGKA